MDKAALITELQASRGHWPEIARNAGVSYSWIVKFANEKIPDPRIGSLERLQVALSSRAGSASSASAP